MNIKNLYGKYLERERECLESKDMYKEILADSDGIESNEQEDENEKPEDEQEENNELLNAAKNAMFSKPDEKSEEIQLLKNNSRVMIERAINGNIYAPEYSRKINHSWINGKHIANMIIRVGGLLSEKYPANILNDILREEGFSDFNVNDEHGKTSFSLSVSIEE